MSYQYRAFGLILESDQPVPGLEPSSTGGAPDIMVTLLGDVPLPSTYEFDLLHHASDRLDDLDVATLVVRRTSDRRAFLFDYRDGSRFLIKDRGARIWAHWPPPLTPEDAATYLLGPVLGFVLRLRGHICLHASCVAVDDEAVAFVGPSGAGKSTLAAALVARGCRALTEDVTPLRLREGRFWVEPGCPVIRLWEPAVEALFGAPDAMPLLTPNWEKRFQPLSAESGTFMSEPRPLRAIYAIGERQGERRTTIAVLPQPEALIELVRNTYANRLLDQEMRAQEFGPLATLVEQVGVRALQFADDTACLPGVCSTIVADAAALGKTPSDASGACVRHAYALHLA
jgi:hypothetical protein